MQISRWKKINSGTFSKLLTMYPGFYRRSFGDILCRIFPPLAFYFFQTAKTIIFPWKFTWFINDCLNKTWKTGLLARRDLTSFVATVSKSASFTSFRRRFERAPHQPAAPTVCVRALLGWNRFTQTQQSRVAVYLSLYHRRYIIYNSLHTSPERALLK